jgi:hypothetical protein
MGRWPKTRRTGAARGRQRIGAPVSILAIAAAVVTTVAVTGAFTNALTARAGPSGPAPSRQQFA